MNSPTLKSGARLAATALGIALLVEQASSQAASTYEFRSRPAGISWQEAQQECENDGGYLAVITSAAENDIVHGLVEPNVVDLGVWLGGFQPAGSGEPDKNWQWIFGEPFDFENWELDEPNNGAGAESEERLSFYTFSGVVRSTWNDVPSEIALDAYVIEFPPDDTWMDLECALAGVNGDPMLNGSGSLADGSNNQVELSNAAPSATAGLFLALASTPVPFKGGTLKPFPFFDPVILITGAGGGITIPFVMPAGIPAGTELWVQWAIQDAAAIHGVALSNAILGVTP